MKPLLITIASFILTFSTQDIIAQSKSKKEKLPLDNEVYITEVTAESADSKVPAKGKPDEVSFKGGKFKSDYFDEKGSFKAANYTVTKDTVDSDEERLIEFETVMKNDNEEEVEIKGTVTGYELEATAKWSKNGKLKREFTVTGSIKKGK